MANFFKDNEGLKFQLSNKMMEEIIRLKEHDYRDKENFDYAPENFEDALDSYEKVLEIVGEITGDIIAPNAEEVDLEGVKIVDNRVVYAKGTTQNHEALRDAGLYGMSLPRQYGGLNFSYVPYVMAAEIVSRGDCSFANIWGLQDCAETLDEFATEDIKNEFLPRINKGDTCSMDLTEPDAGSDLQSVRLKATLDEKTGQWYLNGVKRFITNGDADIKLVLARSEEGTVDGRGLSYFVCYNKQGKDKTITVRRLENKLGIHGSPTAELVFHNTPAKLVGDRKLGLIKYVMSLMNGARLGVAAQSVGLSEAAYRQAYQYATEREQFGKAIINFPQVYEMLSNMRAKIDATRALLYETSRCVDMYKLLTNATKERTLEPEEKQNLKKYQRLADIYTPLLKLFASEYANQVTYDTIQVYGGSGFMKDYPCERMYRDARILPIYEGTAQLQVVAAIRGVINGGYLAQIESYEQQEVSSEFAELRSTLSSMKDQFKEAFERAESFGSTSEFFDFNSRRMVEMCGYMIIGHVLLLDANKAPELFARSCKNFIRLGQSEVEKAYAFIMNCPEKVAEDYKL